MTTLKEFNSYLFRYQIVSLIVLFLLAIQTVNAQEIDILLKGGHVIDPKNNINAKMDVAILNGKIFRVAVNIPESSAKKTVDVSGLYVSPGIIDMHVHVFQGTDKYSTSVANSSRSQQADAFSFRAGVTTMVDAGTSGWRNFRTFKAQSIDKSQTRILAFLNVIGNGMIGRFEEQDINDMNPEMNAYMIKKLFPEILVGIKSAHYWGEFTSVDKAVESGKLADVPIMVDFGEHVPTNSIESLFLKHFRPGDIFTHTYSEISSGRESIVDEKSRKLKPFILEAQKRGVIFDVGHGGGAFSWSQAIPAFKQGFLPDVISSDLHDQSMNAGMKDMTNVMSKFLALGMQLKDVIERSTWAPAKVIKRTDLGHLSVGAEADIAVFNLREGKFGFTDVRKVSVEGSKKLEAELTLRAGKIMWDLNGISGQPWKN
ncbi:MAG: dihydroorotase [Sphingobacteriales bacterium 17-39-43]|uniref:amidohydrolase/deacetylase family metallohydrolase n=1 Tax=Daejeonella sp. TaxID=2805397 RepID=UPI000BC59B74|nr:amidohydrolase/deacetylase family metallohydrolase [Daejeonella sp.]OYZ31554.1 MAG: dihydroorotase [Sphingobacteriales bacterium 16-39-50]OZA24753.1 MAG: dihydroorotase [Sphingobacteriales bacterium 17-39-43]HQS52382.1 amidohydrolase/deacetylase family metallohydrolase [Daejeonella sp.]HQT22646.1 amidohydrolase/deacetylase family metallohydrolase [Daejeonella sp.]HQT57664.1 amidohydrolase/deacetylase family metallohydrolase [Daejeonella sp.]